MASSGLTGQQPAVTGVGLQWGMPTIGSTMPATTLSPSPRLRGLNGLPAVLAVVLTTAVPAHAAVPGSAAAASLAPDRAVPVRAPAVLQRNRAWWMAYDDAGLNLLVRRALEREHGMARLVRTVSTPGAADVDREVVAAYLGARALSARWLALQGVLAASERQTQLLDTLATGAAPTSATPSAQAALRYRREQVVQWQGAVAAERTRLLELLAARCGYDSADLADMLAPALSQPAVPAFGSGVPTRLPRGILRDRSDVALAEGAAMRAAHLGGDRPLRMAESLREVEGWIEPQAGPLDPAAAVGTGLGAGSADDAPPELAELRSVISVAAREVARDLRALTDRATEQATLARHAETNRLAYLAARDRAKTGELSEWQLLEQYQQLLVATERHAAASGALALAWLHLVASTGASPQVLQR